MIMLKRSFPHTDVRDTTVREAIHQALLDQSATIRDISKIVGISEHEVAEHLEHLERSLKHKQQTLVREPSACLDCGFVFTHRLRFNRPGGCPKCRGRRISLPRFSIEAR